MKDTDSIVQSDGDELRSVWCIAKESWTRRVCLKLAMKESKIHITYELDGLECVEP